METEDLLLLLLLYLQQAATDPFSVSGEYNSRYYITVLTFVLVSTFHLLCL